MTGKAIYWNGNQDTNPKAGTIAEIVAGNYRIEWNDGMTQVVPVFVVKSHHGWRIA